MGEQFRHGSPHAGSAELLLSFISIYVTKMPHGNKPSAWGPGAYELASLIGILDTRAYPRSTKKVYEEDVIWLIDQIFMSLRLE